MAFILSLNGVSSLIGFPICSYGGPAPVLSGSVTLDLHRMNRILEVNDDLHYAVVEPGVTWTDLYNYCVEHKKKVWPSTPSLGWGSVIGNVSSPHTMP